MRNPLLDQKYSDYDELEGPTRLIVPFIACGDLNVAPDADKTYPLEIDGREYKSYAPIISPISPPYERAKLMKQNNLLGKQQQQQNHNQQPIDDSTTSVNASATNTNAAAPTGGDMLVIASPDLTTATSNSALATQSSEIHQRLSSFQNDENNSKLSDLTISN